MRRKIQEVSLWVMIFAAFTWLLTVIEMFFIPDKGLMTVIRINGDVLTTAMLVFVVSSWWNTIRHFFRRMTRKII